MPLLSVSVDGVQVAAVTTDGLDVLTANLGGTKIDEEFAHLELSGGKYPSEGESTHLIWLNGLVVKSGQRIRVEIDASGASSHAGKTINELFPEETEEPESSPLLSAVVDILEHRPKVRSDYHFAINASQGESCTARISLEEHGFGVSFLWNSVSADRVSASLHTYSLEQLRSGGGFTYHWRKHLRAGEWAEISIDA